MKQYLDLKVDLENPDEARHTIDELVKMYEEDKLKWTAEELAEAKHLAMKIMEQLCLDGHSIEWYGVKEACRNKTVAVWLSEPNNESFWKNETCYINSAPFDTWIAKCVCLCRATGRSVPAFIVKKGW